MRVDIAWSPARGEVVLFARVLVNNHEMQGSIFSRLRSVEEFMSRE